MAYATTRVIITKHAASRRALTHDEARAELVAMIRRGMARQESPDAAELRDYVRTLLLEIDALTRDAPARPVND